MASEIKVNKISPESGTTLTLGDSGDTISFASGVLPNLENLTVTGDLTVDTNSLKVDSTNNRVGIGTATPSVSLDVVGAITATGNITGTLATAAQPNITSVGTLTGLTSTGIDDNATSTAITIDSSENVGIKSTTPSSDAWSGANSLVIKDTSGDNGITIISSSTTNNGNIAFADSSGGSFSDIGGLITYLHNGDSMRFMTANAERMRLNATGLGIGTSSPGAGLEVDNANGIKISRSGYSQYMQLYPANNNIPTILGVGGNGIHIGTTTTTGIQVDGSDNVLINTTSASGFDSAGLPLIVGSGSTHQGITIFSGTSHQGAIHFADGTGTSSYRGQLNYKHDADAMTFATSGSEKMRLNSTGLLGIGSTNPTTPIHINSNTPIITFEETDQSNRKFQIGSFGNAYAIYDATNTQYRYVLDNSGNHIFNEGSQDCDFRVESNNNANMLFVDGGNDRVGIGESAPLGKLHITSLGSGASVSGDGDDLIIENGTSAAAAGISILSATNGYGNIMFGDSGDNNIGVFQYDHNGNFMRFIVNASERARLDASGDMLIGKTSISTNAVGVALTGLGLGAFTRSGDAPLIANRTTSDGDAILIRKDNSTVGVIGTQKWGIGNSNPQNKLDISATTWDDGLTIKNTGNFNVGIIGDANRSGAGGGLLNLQARWNGTEVSGILFQAGSDTTNKDDGEIVFRTASAGTPTERVKIHTNGVMSASNGIALGVGSASTASNVLDDYEEGTWTPGLDSVSSSNASGQYTKIGNVCTAKFKISADGSGSNINITGFPFTSGSGFEQQGLARETESVGDLYFIRISGGNTVGTIIRYDANNSITSNDTFEGQVTYITNT